MTFESPWALLLLVLPMLWTIPNWGGRRRDGRMLALAVSAGVLVLALSQPKLAWRESRIAVTVLKDTSAGIADRDLLRESEFIEGLEKARGRHVVRVIPFAETMRETGDPERIESSHLAPTPGPAGRGTDIETAVREGIATLPAGRVPRLVILSDGLENSRSAQRAALQAQRLGIPIDTIPLVAGPRPEPHMGTEAAPARVSRATGSAEAFERPPGVNRASGARTCVVVVFETSRLMEGQKMELARLAALGLIENLRRSDLVGVLAFEDSFRWIIPIQVVGERDPLNHAIDDVTAGGGVRIAPALEEALRGMQPVDARFKHIVVLTDGVSRDPAALALARKAATEHVKVSVISLGEDLNRRYFGRLVEFSRGESLVLHDPSGLMEASMVGFHDADNPVESWAVAAVRAIPPPHRVDTDSTNESLLRWISESTGGRFNPSPSSIFEPDGRTVIVFLRPWPVLVLFALGLTLLEMIPGGQHETRGRLKAFLTRHPIGHPSTAQPPRIG
jgi:Mg-chelatase subunit ChlD